MPSEIAVGFDFDHTLGLDNKIERTTALDMLAALAASGGHAYDGAAADAAVDDVLAAYRRGEQSIEAAVAGFFERFAPSGSKTVDHAGDFRETVLERTSTYIEPLPGAIELLAELDELGIRYALLTNGWSPLQEEKARKLGFRGSVFVSERIGVRKPSPEAFEFLTKHFELPPERVWYVGDDPVTDCVGAQECGLTSVWFDWEGHTYPADAAPPAHVIHALSELPSLLRDRLSAPAKADG